MKKQVSIFFGLALALLSITSCNRFQNLEEPEPLMTTRSGVVTPDQPSLECQEFTFLDPGMCGGIWFMSNQGEYFEVFEIREPGSPVAFEPGEIVNFNYEAYEPSDVIQCMALTSFEQDLYDSGQLIHRVSLLDICTPQVDN